MKKSTCVYIDGFNLYYRLKKTPFKWLNLGSFVNSCLNLDKHRIEKIKYFSAKITRTPFDPQKPIRQNMYLSAIRTIPNIDVILGRFKKREITGLLCDSKGKETEELVTIKKFEEKNSDVNIATHLVADGYEGKYDCAVLISNDSDLTTPLLHIKKNLGKTVVVISPYKKIQVDLKKSSHYCKKLSSDDIFRENQFPQKIKIGKREIHCPKDWLGWSDSNRRPTD